MVDRIKALAKEKKVSISFIEQSVGIGNGIIGKWKKQSPSCDKLKLVADYLNTSIDYLVYGEDKLSSIENLSDDKKKLLHMYSLLSDMEKGEILGELKAITKNRNIITKNDNIQTAKAVARSFDNHPPETIIDDFSDLFNAPDATNKYQK